MTNPILTILSNEKLTEENFMKWKSNMNLILIYENYKFVLNEECPPLPAANASRTIRDAYEKWIDSNNKTRTKEYMLVYSESDLIHTGYSDADFQLDRDEKAEYVVAAEAAKEAVWLHNFLIELEVVPNLEKPLTLFCDNSAAISITKEVRNHKRAKHIDRKYHLIREIVKEGKVSVQKITSQENIADPFTKILPERIFQKHVQEMGLRKMSNLL
ncbi:hypothetical protein KFK09_002540 [Dendrobium nobile]|uniref:Retrovirus-related pol polyprotein from transposon tnt 1-94 n=1 Tax=Dendrobium nobile TaxID=94219 RepID=A0A8T3C7D7_DENNO|nr:hypothetical protein KFK09_002540 [Dendrobium nobile]